MVVYEDTLDDSADADLPVTATRIKHLSKFVEDGGAATVYSSEDASCTSSVRSNLELIMAVPSSGSLSLLGIQRENEILMV